MHILVIVLFNIIIYYKTISYDLVMDDRQWWNNKMKYGFMRIREVKNLSSLKNIIDEHLYSGTTFGTNTKIEHSFTIFLHTAICVLIYLTFGSSNISFCAAMLYSCNPINNQTSIWLNGRRYAINTILVLLMIIFPLMSPLLYLFTGVLQVTAFFSPVALIGHSYWYLALIPLLIGFGWRQIKNKCDSRSDNIAEGDLKKFTPRRFIVIVKTFGFFFFKMIVPQVCAMQYPDRFYWGLTKEGNKDAYSINMDFWKGVGAISCNVLAFYYLPNSLKPFLCFMFLAILQWSAILPITQILSDRYCSLPNVFMMFFLSYFLINYLGIFGISAIVIIFFYYLICLSVVMPMYKDIMYWYNYNIDFNIKCPWPRTLLISDLMSEGKKDEASAYASEGLKNNQKDYSLLMWGAIFSLIRLNFEHCEAFLNEAEKNFYIGQEEKQRLEVKNMRDNLKKLRPKRNGFR